MICTIEYSGVMVEADVQIVMRPMEEILADFQDLAEHGFHLNDSINTDEEADTPIIQERPA